ncbi:MAG: EamA family transporter [Hahellaceae bacterium]|nr:EamA family transporter [Hahellaceae bacterium]
MKSDGLLVLVTLLAAFGWIFSKEALQGLPPHLFIGIRFTCASIVLVLLFWKRHAILRHTPLRPILLSGALFAGALTLWIGGLYHTRQLGVGAFLTSLAIVLVPVASQLLFRERVAFQSWLAIPISFSGLALLALEEAITFESGQLYFLTAALLFSVHFTMTSQVARQVPAIPLTSCQLMFAGLVNLIVSPFIETAPNEVASSIWVWVAASVLLATCLRFSLQFFAQSLASSSHAAIILTLEPVFTTLLAYLWFAETLSLWQGIGCSLIFMALLVARWHLIKPLFKRSL